MRYFILIAPGVIAFYLMFLRSRLRALPAFQEFYAEADTFWQKVWAVCGKSVTMAWSYVLLAIGGVFGNLDNISGVVGDPSFKQQVADVIGADPKAMGYFAMFVSLVTIATRLRGIAKSAGG